VNKPHKRMGPQTPREDEFLSTRRQIRFGPTLTRLIDAARGVQSFSAWLRSAAWEKLGLSDEPTQDPANAPDEN
jgi:hypothetical protein